MTNSETLNNLKNLFNTINSFKSLKDLNDFISQENLENEINNFYEKYPKIKLAIQKSEIEDLKNHGILDENNKLDKTKFIGSPLERLLAATLWKNGDINKIQHIVDGILQLENDRTDYSLIFKQFGYSLTNSSEPIVDQHVLRAYEIISLNSPSEITINLLRKKGIYKTTDKEILDNYRTWFKGIIQNIPSDEQVDFKEKLDKVLFIKGKAVKLKKKKDQIVL